MKQQPYLVINKEVENLEDSKKAELLLNIAKEIKLQPGSISDGYHKFDEIYDYRKVYNALAFNILHKQGVPIIKSRKHSDGEYCFGGGWFIVVALLPTGQVSNHYEERDWNLFDCPEVEIPERDFTYDGHSSEEAFQRLLKFVSA